MNANHKLHDRISARWRPMADGVALAALAGCALWLVWPVLIDGKSLYFRDMQIFFVPMKQFLVEWLSRGVIPFWDPAMFSGSPFFADMQTTILYPPTLLLLVAEGMHGLGLLILFHLLLAAFSAYAYGRLLGLARPAAYLLALLFGAGGLMVSTFNMINFMQALAWVPLVLLCFERDTRAPTAGHFTAAVAALALQIYAGAPEVTLMLALLILARQLTADLRSYLGRVVRTGLAGLAALLLAAPQLLPTLELFRLSVRTQGLAVSEIASYSLRWSDLSHLVRSPPFDNQNWDIFTLFPDGYVPLFLSLYLGPVALLAAVAALVLCPRRTPVWLGLGGVGLFLALGGNNPWALALFEGVGIFRYPEKYVLVLFFALTMLAALGLDAAVRRWSGRRWLMPVVGLLCALATVDLLDKTGRVTLLGPGDYYRMERLPESRLVTQLGQGRAYSRAYYQPGITRVRELYDGYRRQFSPHVGTLGGMEYINGTGGLVLKSHQLVDRLLQPLPPSRALAQRLAFLNTRYVLSADPAFANSREWRRLAAPRSRFLWDLGPSRAWAYFPGRVVPEASMSLLAAAQQPDFARGEAALIEAGAAGQGLVGRVLEVSRPSPNRFQLQVETATRALLVVSESHYPGWRLWVDDRPATIERVNHLYMGAWLEPGQHLLRFEFVPRGLYLGLGLAALTALLLAGCAYRFRRRPLQAGAAMEAEP